MNPRSMAIITRTLSTTLFALSCAAPRGGGLAAKRSAAAQSQPRGAPGAAPVLVSEHQHGAMRLSKWRLGNGLEIVLGPDPAARSVSYMTWFRVGSRHENAPAGETGLAHLFEHLMFTQTASAKADGEFDRELEAVGAEVNAMTWVDYTAYVNNLPPDAVPLAARLEADRMANLALRKTQVETEREVVAEERLSAVEDSVDGTLDELVHKAAFSAHPYHWPVIGWMPDIKAVTREKAQRFYKTFYGPNNAVLVLTGKFDPEATLTTVARIYGGLAPVALPDTALRPEAAREQAPVAAQRIAITRPVAADRLLLAFAAPAMGHPDRAAFEVLDEILTGGPSSRLRRALVIEAEIASSVDGGAEQTRDPGLYLLWTQLREGHASAQAETMVEAAVQTLAREPVSAAELAGAKNRLAADFWSDFSSSGDRAELLGEYEILTGDFRNAFARPGQHRAVTADDVRRMAAQYLVVRPRIVAVASPLPGTAAANPPPAAPARPPEPAIAAAASAPADTPERPLPSPAPAELAPVRLPGPGGSLMMLEPNFATRLVQVVVATRAGAARDPRGLEGLSNLAAEVARRGAAGKSRAALDRALDQMGATLDVLTDAESVRLTGHVLIEHLDAYLDLLASIMLRPDFSEDEIGRTSREVLAQLDDLRADDRALCGRYFEHRLFGRHGYGQPADGTRASLASLAAGTAKQRRERLLQHFRAQFAGRNLVFAATGPLLAADFSARLRQHFATLPPGKRAPDRLAAASPPRGWRIELVDKPDRQQVQIMFGHLGLPADHPDRLPLSIALTAFGGGAMNATLMSEVRVKRGLAYGAYLSDQPRRAPGAIRGYVFTGSENAVKTLQLVLRLYKEFHAKGLSAERVRFFQNFMLGGLASDLDHPAARLGARVAAELHGLPADHVDTLATRLARVTPEQVAAAIEKYLTPDDLAITMVGTAASVKKALLAAKVAESAIDVVDYRAY